MPNYFENTFYKRLYDVFASDGAFNGATRDLQHDENAKGVAERYTVGLLNEPYPVQMWGFDPDNYYYQMAAHCYCSGLCIATWYQTDDNFNYESAFQALTSMDSTLLIRAVLPKIDDFALEKTESIRYEQFLSAFKRKIKKVDNTDEDIVAAMILFFMMGVCERLEKFSPLIANSLKNTKASELLRDENKHPKCDYVGRENECSINCDDCFISIKTKGDLAFASKDFNSAIQHYRDSLSKEPLFAEAWVNLGNSYGFKSDYENALLAFNKAIEIDETYGKALLGKAITLRNTDNFDEAIVCLERILEMYDNDLCKKMKSDIVKHLNSDF